MPFKISEAQKQIKKLIYSNQKVRNIRIETYLQKLEHFQNRVEQIKLDSPINIFAPLLGFYQNQLKINKRKTQYVLFYLKLKREYFSIKEIKILLTKILSIGYQIQQKQDLNRQKMFKQVQKQVASNPYNVFHIKIILNKNHRKNRANIHINYPKYGHTFTFMNQKSQGPPTYPIKISNSNMVNPPRMGSDGYIPPPMIMNPQYFNSGPMPYNIPNSDDKSKEGRPQYPMYYPPPWNGYMMPPPSMIPANEGNSEQARPAVPPPYRMMPHPPQPNGPKTISTGSNVNQMPNMGSNMVYMQYPMGPRYPYMGYPYMPKQGQQPPRDP